MNISGLSVKETMEAIEERIPFGRWVVKLLLFLAVLAIIVWLCEFLYHDLVFPIVMKASPWFATGTIKIRPDEITLLVFGLLVVAIIYVVGNYILRRLRALFEYVEPMLREASESISKTGVLATTITDLKERVTKLENRQSSVPSAKE